MFTLRRSYGNQLPIMIQMINMSIDNDCYLDDLKLAEVSAGFEKKEDYDKEIYKENHIKIKKIIDLI